MKLGRIVWFLGYDLLNISFFPDELKTISPKLQGKKLFPNSNLIYSLITSSRYEVYFFVSSNIMPIVRKKSK